MKSIKYILLITILPLSVSCAFFGAGAKPQEPYLRLLTGECLNNTELSYVIPAQKEHYLHGDSFFFYFEFDLNNHQFKKWTLMDSWTYKDVPSDGIFETFGDNMKEVRNEYEAIFEIFEMNRALCR